jgi:dihydroneopterin aldolase
MTDAIRIRGLEAQTRVGVTQQERADAQTVTVDLEIYADLTRAGASDALEDTIDYGDVAATVVDTIRSSESRLLEHLATKIASVVSRMDGVTGVAVEIAKRPPPVDERVDSIGVRIERHAT